MAENTKIEWADHTFNPWVGCQKVSAACDNCYAEDWAKRWGQVEWGPRAKRKRTGAANWRKPLAWDRAAAKAGRRDRVFCASLADVFDNKAPKGARDDLWALIRATPNLDWLLLTKRPQNIAGMLPGDWARQPYPNVWLGTTVENQEEADRRIPHLLKMNAVKRFLSCEPLLGSVDLGGHLNTWWNNVLGEWWPAHGRGLHMVIVGGESGPKARPMHPDWARSIRDQCVAAGMPFFFKQWGEWMPWEPAEAPYWINQSGGVEDGNTLFPSDFDKDQKWDDGLWAISEGENVSHAAFQRVGKARAGRLLDGREWNEVPA